MSHSEANQLAARWAAKAETGDQKLVSYHGRWYIVDAFDDMPLGYQIVGRVRKSDYSNVVKEIEYDGSKKPIQESSDRVNKLNQRRNPDERGGYGSDSFGTRGGRREDNRIQRLGSEQISRRTPSGETGGGYESGGKDQQRSDTNVKFSIESSSDEFDGVINTDAESMT